jgi:hypothetical protein
MKLRAFHINSASLSFVELLITGSKFGNQLTPVDLGTAPGEIENSIFRGVFWFFRQYRDRSQLLRHQHRIISCHITSEAIAKLSPESRQNMVEGDPLFAGALAPLPLTR